MIVYPFSHAELSLNARAVLLVITNNSQRVCVLHWLTCSTCADFVLSSQTCMQILNKQQKSCLCINAKLF